MAISSVIINKPNNAAKNATPLELGLDKIACPVPIASTDRISASSSIE